MIEMIETLEAAQRYMEHTGYWASGKSSSDFATCHRWLSIMIKTTRRALFINTSGELDAVIQQLRAELSQRQENSLQ